MGIVDQVVRGEPRFIFVPCAVNHSSPLCVFAVRGKSFRIRVG
jgi:hypothetical protein